MDSDPKTLRGTLPPASLLALWVVRILLLISIVFVCWPPPSFALPLAIPYLFVLWRLRARTQKKGLGLAAVIGSVVFVWCLSYLTAAPDRCASPNVVSVYAVSFCLLQLALAGAAVNAYRALRRQLPQETNPKQDIVRPLFYGLPLMILGALVVPNLSRARMPAGEAGPASIFRTINTAEVTYASTYNKGFSPSLAALGPPAPGRDSSTSAADLLDSVLASGTQREYRFEYTPGPVEQGRILTYTITARPIRSGCGPSWFSDETGVIRRTQEERPAKITDPPI